MSPSERPHAEQMQMHHLWWARGEWRNAGLKAHRVRNHDRFIIPITGLAHDNLHDRIQPIKPPSKNVLDKMYELARESPAQLPLDWLDTVAVTLLDEARAEASYELSDQLLTVACHLSAQTGLMRLGN